MKAAVVVLAFLVCLSGMAVAGDDEQRTKFKFMTRRADDAVEVRVETDRTVFSVKSPFGISQAVIERTDDKWPAAVVLTRITVRLPGLVQLFYSPRRRDVQ